MGLTAYLDKGVSLGRDAPCLTLDGVSPSYGDVADLSHAVARALARSGVRAGDKVAILSGNDPRAFACVIGITRRGAVWYLDDDGYLFIVDRAAGSQCGATVSGTRSA